MIALQGTHTYTLIIIFPLVQWLKSGNDSIKVLACRLFSDLDFNSIISLTHVHSYHT